MNTTKTISPTLHAVELNAMRRPALVRKPECSRCDSLMVLDEDMGMYDCTNCGHTIVPSSSEPAEAEPLPEMAVVA